MTNAPAERPAAFDAAVMAYLPGLHSLAKQYVPRQYRNDLVTDTIIAALSRWESFRPDGHMWAWLTWQMRGIVKEQTVKAGAKMRSGTMLPLEDWTHAATMPTQDDAAELSLALSRLASIKDGNIVLRRSMGDGLEEIAATMGLSRERVRQREDKARARLRKVVARGCA